MSRSSHEPAENHSSDRGTPDDAVGWPGPALADDPLFGPMPTGPGGGSAQPWAPRTGTAPWHAPQAWQPSPPDDDVPAPDGPERVGQVGFDPAPGDIPDGHFPDGHFPYDGSPGDGSPGGPPDDKLPDDDLPDDGLTDDGLADDDLSDEGTRYDVDWDGPPAGRLWAWNELSQSLAGRVVAFVTVALVVAVLVILFAGDDSGDVSGAGSDEPTPEPRQVAADFVNSIRTDSDPVVPGEFFGQAEVTVSGREYTRLNARLDGGCPELTGAAGTLLTEGNCRQLARAVYLSPPEPSGRLVLAGVSVFVVDETATAQAAAEVFQTRQGGVVALPVTPEQVPGATVLTPAGDNSWRQALTRGHYVIVLEVAYSDGSAGSPQDPPLRTTISDIEQVAVVPISDRARLGQGPPAPATTSPASAPPASVTTPEPAPAA